MKRESIYSGYYKMRKFGKAGARSLIQCSGAEAAQLQQVGRCRQDQNSGCPAQPKFSFYSSLSIIVALLLLMGCARNCSDTALYEKSGQMKPIVLVMPVINRTHLELPWNVAQELTDEIRKRIYDSSKLYLLRDAGSLEIAKTLACPNPFEISPAILQDLGASEFVVIAELLEQEQMPYGKVEEAGGVLALKMRVRVIDRRHPQPKVVLQELLEYDHMIARPYLNADYEKTPWGVEAFQNTPMGLAHSKIVRELVSHVEGYVKAAR